MSDIQVTLRSTMGSDLDVVNVARVSFAKESEWSWDCPHCGDDPDNLCWQFDDVCGYGGKPIQGKKVLKPSDAKLIAFLARNSHWSPFSHQIASFRIKAPLFVARQLWKSHIGLASQDDSVAWNEVSRRYVSSDIEFYTPMVWRLSAEDKKQGSSDTASPWQPTGSYDRLCELAAELYKDMVSDDVNICPEQARMVLPQSLMTEWIWTGSLAAFARICKDRLSSDAQSETRDVATMIDIEMGRVWPVSWKELMSV